MAICKKILILRFSSIGDIVLTTPVVRCLKLQTAATIHYATKAQYSSILQSNPYIDKVFCLEKSLSALLILLKAERYDAIIDLHNNLRTWRIKRTLRIPHYTFDKINFKKWLLVNFKINFLPKVHIVDRYLQAAAPLGIENDGQGLDYFIPAKDKIDLSTFFYSYNFNTKNAPFISFVIGATHATKRLPIVKIIEICKKIPFFIVLLGGSAEAEEGKTIAAQAGKHVLNLCGQTNLNQSAALVQQSAQVISHDTGLMHIAAAFQKKIISVWGNTIPAFGMYPYYKKGVNENTSIEVQPLACRPCSKIGYQKCPKQHFKCMQQLDIKSIVNSITLKDKDKKAV